MAFFPKIMSKGVIDKYCVILLRTICVRHCALSIYAVRNPTLHEDSFCTGVTG